MGMFCLKELIRLSNVEIEDVVKNYYVNIHIVLNRMNRRNH